MFIASLMLSLSWRFMTNQLVTQSWNLFLFWQKLENWFNKKYFLVGAIKSIVEMRNDVDHPDEHVNNVAFRSVFAFNVSTLIEQN